MQSVTKSQERKSARFWGVFILALLAINLMMAVFAIVVAVGDPSFRPMPSYGEHAIDWESQKQLQAKSDALGWQAKIERNADGTGFRCALSDRNGQPISGAAGEALVYHFTRANEAEHVPLKESPSEKGVYVGTIDTSKDGHWQIRMELQRDDQERFFFDHEVEWYRK